MPNLAFELQKDKGLRDDNALQPYEIVNLWQLMEFLDVGKLIVSVMWLTNLAHRGTNVSWFRIPVRI